jgi:S-adenosylmethionine hydrolase
MADRALPPVITFLSDYGQLDESVEDDHLRSDTFGNLILDAADEQLAGLGAALGDTLMVSRGGAVHATRRVALAVNRGSAAELLGASADDELQVRPA